MIILLLAVGILYYAALGTIPLVEPDEGRYAEIPREMLVQKDYVTPHLNGVAYLEKPPLFYWGNAASLALFGRDEFGARFFTATVSIAGVLLTYWMGTVLGGPRTGLFAAMVLSTSFYYYVIGRFNTPDMTLAVTLILSLFPGYLYLSGKRRSRGYLLLSYAGAALAFLTKGLVGCAFPAGILILWMFATGRTREIGRAIYLPGIALFLAMILPWMVRVQRANPDFLWFFFVHEQFLRYTTKIHQRYQPFWFFVPVLVGGLLPWLAYGHRAVAAVRGFASEWFDRDDRRFLYIWPLFILLFFSFSDSKLITYISPVFPPVAVLLGRALELWADQEDGVARFRFPLLLAALLAAGVMFFPPFTRHPIPLEEWLPQTVLPAVLLLAWGATPLFLHRLGAKRVMYLSFVLLALFLVSLNQPAGRYLDSYRSVKHLASALNTSLHGEDLVAQYGTYQQGIPFYTGRRTVQVNSVGELEFGAERSADRKEYFQSDQEFQKLWNSQRRIFCVFNRNSLSLIRQKFPEHKLLYDTDAGVLVVNR